MKDEFVMVGDGISEGCELLGKGLGRIVEQQTVAHIKRAEQCRGEPVLYYKPLSGAEAKPTGECYSVFFVPMPGHQPLFAHADPAEVERLRAGLRDEIEAGDSWKREAEDLRAQLAERDALLARVVNSGALSSEQYESLEADCCAAVDAVHQIKRLRIKAPSAEPSAPDEREELRSHLDRMIGQAEYMLELAENSFDGEADEDDGSFDECREYIEQARAALERKP